VPCITDVHLFRAIRSVALVAALPLLAACTGSERHGSPDAGNDDTAYALNVTAIDRRFDTRDHFIASVEMQLSGEPFAEAMGRDLGGFARDYSCQESVCSPSVYVDPMERAVDGGAPEPVIDLAGFSSGIESYEYSKQPMNNVAFESGAGTSLLFGPLSNPDGVTGAAALKLAQAFIGHVADETNVTSRVVVGEPPDGSPLGWPGFWPTLQPFTSWDPAIRPTNESGCSLSSDDNPTRFLALMSNLYECDYSTLNLPDRAAQVTRTIGPGASGWAAFKYALWTLNYLQVMHDVRGNIVERVIDELLDQVGEPGNLVGPGFLPGTYLGSSDIEGFQAATFLQILDNQAAQWLFELGTTDGKSLGGFANLSEALSYGSGSTLRWFPSSIAVEEVPDESGFPRPSSYEIDSADSHLLDLSGLLGAYASVYALTDRANVEVGGSQPARAYFDGDPFPVQNQTPSGEPTLHDRALAMMRVLVVDIDRLHVDPESDTFADDAQVERGRAKPGKLLSTDVAAYTLLALRTVRRSLGSALTLYGNTTPDTQGIPTPLDVFPLSDKLRFGERLDQLILLLSEIFYDKLSTPEGHAYAGWDLTRGQPSDEGTRLVGHAGAIRGLLVAYLATGAPRYRDRAERVWTRLERAFYDRGARIYRSSEGDRSRKVTFTPRGFGLMQGALRDIYELVATLPGNDAMRPVLEARVGRLDTLVLNGWDDRDGDQKVEWPAECAQLGKGADGKTIGLGGLQMAERTLSGETGSIFDPVGGDRIITPDRERDCVPEISAVGLPAALARSITFSLTPIEGVKPEDAGAP
jgi:hypothetical protein